MQKIVIIIGILLCLFIGVAAQAGDIATQEGKFKPGSEPNGFRGIEWGTDISTLKGMKHLYTRRSPPIVVYERSSDELKLGSAILGGISYGFWHNKFGRVHAFTRYKTNFIKLINVAVEKFGEGYQETDGVVYYLRWYGPKTRITLKYHNYTGDCQISLFSRKVDKEIENWEIQQAKEGAKTGF